MSTIIYRYGDDYEILASFVCQMTTGWDVDHPSTVSDYPVERDTERSDHVQPELSTYTFTATQSEAMEEGAMAPRNLRDFLEDIRRARSLCAIQHRRYGFVSPVVLKGLGETMATNLEEFTFTMTWKEVEVAVSTEVLIAPRPQAAKVTTDGAECLPNEDHGSQPTSDRPGTVAPSPDGVSGRWGGFANNVLFGAPAPPPSPSES